MRKCKLFVVIVLMMTTAFTWAQSSYNPSPENAASREEFSYDRFGIFIHWGIYSMLGQGEWAMQLQNLDYQEYARLAGGFNPSRFDAREWVRAIKASGAKYITITSRHHDGFSMFRSAASTYNIVDATPFGRDVIGELAEACREEGIRLHFYYSHLDWGRTDYWPRGRTGRGTGRPEGRDGDWRHYLGFINAQLTELLTQYGPVGAIWFDGLWDMDSHPREEQPAIWNLEEQYALIHRLQPGCLIGNNHHIAPFEGEDIQIFERDLPGENEAGYSEGQEIAHLPLETCQTMNRSWGYDIKDKDYKSPEDLIRYLVRTAGKGANLLLNIGPRPDGTLPEEALDRLAAIGTWMDVYGETIYGTEAGCTGPQDWGVSTQKGDILYLHVLDPADVISVDLERRIKSAESFPEGSALRFEQKKNDSAHIYLPEAPEGTVDQVVKLVLR